MKIGTKLTLLLLAVFLVGVVGSGIILNRVLTDRAEDEVATRGLILIETMASVRSYTGTHINPMLQDELQTETEFVRESVPGYSARTVFEIFRDEEDHEDFLYKEATINPTNPVDQADGFETELVEQFRADRDLEEINGFRTRDGQRVFYIARPMTVSSESCLACHSTPEAAPVSLVNTYPEGGGFGWELGDVIAAQIIYVPADEVLESARLSFFLIIGIFVGVFMVVLITLNLVMRPTIVSPVKALAGVAQRVRDDTLTNDDLEELSMAKVTTRNDELGQLARIFNKMAQEVYKREQRLKQKLQELRIEIDVARKSEQVSEITDSEYFLNLQKRARDLRNDSSSET
jgi:HAMP domain-containing protein